jgi:DNA-binding CsgD family transcriptional regulator/PAS domain-containing protein
MACLVGERGAGQVGMTRAETILAAVGPIHEAALTPDGWTRALPLIAGAVRSEHALLLAQAAGGETAAITSFAFTSHQLACFAAACAREPRWIGLLEALPPGAVLPSSAIEPDDAFARSAFYNEGIRPTGAFYGITAAPLRTSQRKVYLTAGRALGRENYDAEDVAAMRTLLPHVVTALQVSRRLAQADLRAAGANAALDRLEVGVLLLDAEGQIMFANRAAECLLDRTHGLCVDPEGLSAADPVAAVALRRLIAACSGSTPNGVAGGGIVDVPRGGKQTPLRLLIAPCGEPTAPAEMHWLGPAAAAAIVLISDPERERTQRKKRLRERLGLTPAEADVALEIMRGDGRDAAAARLGISLTTVRTHLSHIFEKAGVHRQAELVSLLLRDETDLAR